MKWVYSFICLLIINFILNAQCLRIESILVDACNGSTSANPEDFNEMVRFRTGSTPLPISQISIAGAGASGVFQLNKWPNTTKSWHGLVQNANTAALVAALNSSIQACGYIKEPPGGIIPPNSEVILVTSQYMNPLLNSFANLNDTIYMVFQDTVNAKGQGHFANWNSTPSYRYLCLIDNSTGCKDTVRYNVALLPLHTDGDAVEYGPVVPNYKLRDTNYVNRGCQAPFIPLSININGASSYTICKNNSINLNASTSNIGYSSIQWSSANGSFSAPNSFTTSFTPTSNFTGSTWVYCTIFKPCGTGFNSAKDSVLIVVRDTVHIVTSINPSSTICSNQTATLSVNITNTASAGTYSIQWLPSNSTNSFITTNTPGTYTVKVSNFCGTVSKTLNLNAVPVPSITIIAPTTTTFCNGNTATIIANSNLTNYTWSTGATNTSSITVNSSGNYSVSVSNSCGTASAAISINYINTPTISITQTPSVVCNGQTYTITANTNASNISWSNGSTSTSFTNNTSAIYTVTASNACGSATASIQVQVNNIPPLQLSTSKDTLCLNDSAIINVTGGNGVYLWNNGVSSNSLIAHSTGWYIVSSTTTCGVLKDSIYIFADNTNIHTSITDTAGFIGTEIGVICNGCNPNSTIWSFGDGSTSTFTFITHSYTQAGYYPVIVKTTTPAGCLLSDTLYVRIYDEVIFEVPNVFTPNGDNVNDYFFVRTRFIKELNGQIFNRWGNLMFEFQSVNDQWDGKNKEGIEASDGTYYYMFKAKDITNKIHEKKGFLQLLH